MRCFIILILIIVFVISGYTIPFSSMDLECKVILSTDPDDIESDINLWLKGNKVQIYFVSTSAISTDSKNWYHTIITYIFYFRTKYAVQN
jgi:hypothetical protein